MSFEIRGRASLIRDALADKVIIKAADRALATCTSTEKVSTCAVDIAQTVTPHQRNEQPPTACAAP